MKEQQELSEPTMETELPPLTETAERHIDHDDFYFAFCQRNTELIAALKRERELQARIDFNRLDNLHPATHCLRLLGDCNISVGKACEYLSKYFLTGQLDPIAEELLLYDPMLDEVAPSEIARRLVAAESQLLAKDALIASLNAEISRQNKAEEELLATGEKLAEEKA